MFRRLLLIVWALLSGYVHAFPATTEPQWNPPPYNGTDWYNQAQADAICAQQGAGYSFYSVPARCGTSQAQAYNNGNPWQPRSGSSCPANSTLSGSECTCNSGYTVNGANNGCDQVNTCGAAGTPGIQNYTVGYGRTSTQNANDIVIFNGNPPGSICDGTCSWTVVQDGRNPRDCWRSQVPAANGLHRLSCDYAVTSTGATCSGRTSNTDPSAPPPPCPGQQGTVNGRPVCLDGPSGPLPQQPNGSPATERMGNPAAGTMPSTGQGSGSGAGRTPTAGDGGPGGGGSNATNPGGGSDGNGQVSGGGASGGGITVNVPEIETCGLPGKPRCRIDETGTGDGNGAYSSRESEFDTAKTEHQSVIEGWGANTEHRPEWTWTFAFPSGCTNLSVPAFAPFLDSIDVCQWQPQIHDVMSMIWVATAIFVCTAMVFRTLNTSG